VAAVMDLSEGEHLERELMLVKVRAEGAACDELKRVTNIFHGRVIDESESTCTIELTDTCARLDEFLQAIDREMILETVRTGASGIGRGERILKL
jgi:acetolactate synthase-1/3 small subunit